MLFNTISFIYIFLPLLLVIYYLGNQTTRNITLLVASVFFYFSIAPKYLPIIFSVIIICYLGGLLIAKFPKFKLLTSSISVMSILFLLFYYKYFNFIIEIFNTISVKGINLEGIILPLGISFYTFQALSYIIDVYRETCPAEKNFFKIALYIMLFPQLISGPIVRYPEIEKQITTRDESTTKFEQGMTRFIIGLAKKVLIADTLGIFVDKIFIQSPDTLTHITTWLGAIGYTLQIYYDFSGYSDMAIGLCLIFGFQIPENFNYPLMSKSISEFWRRWNITLSNWFKDYLFYPLMRSKTHDFLCKIINPIANNTNSVTAIFLIITWALIGLWHGAAWTFVFYGIYHGIFIVIEMFTGLNRKSDKLMINVAKHIYTLIVVCSGIVIFRAENLAYAFNYLKNMFLFTNNGIDHPLIYYIDTIEIIAIIVGIIIATPICSKISNTDNLIAKNIIRISVIILLLVTTAQIADMSYNTFIYFKF